MYAFFALCKILSLLRPAIVPYLRRRAGKRARAASALNHAGISILIPEHRTPQLLGECLSSVQAACQFLQEPWEVIVVVNGAEESKYTELRRKFEHVRWLFFPKALGFHGAVFAGLPATIHDWVYLLNSDMVLDPLALAELLPWRGPGVFAIASQIFFHDPRKRREETGWTQMVTHGGMVEFWDVLPECPNSVRGTVYAGGGASLFQKQPLQHFLGRHSAYPPAYYEDIEWGVVAWKNGYASLFCPRSKVTHRHRATHSQIYSESELTIIFRINQCRFQLRNPMPGRLDWDFLKSADAGALLAAVKGRSLPGAIAHRFASLFYPWGASILEHAHMAWVQDPPADLKSKPTVLMVAPHFLFPPTHGGAIRITRLLEELRGAFHFVLLTDEGESYTQFSRGYLPLVAGLHPISGRRESSAGKRPRMTRIKSHSNEKLRDWLEWLLVFYQPDLVQIEWIECAALLKRRPARIPWVLTLHEVLLSDNASSITREDRFELKLIRRYSAVIACCDEDAALLPGITARVVPNGMKLGSNEYTPSSLKPIVLFVGALRYPPNLMGIQIFLRGVYPRLRQSIRELELWILGGVKARQSTALLEEFQQPGVTVVDYVEVTQSWFNRCALTINPLLGMRGSCIKIMDSLSAGRVCISTRQGARGLAQFKLPPLITVETIEEFEPILFDLLMHVDKRRAVERLSDEHLAELAWQKSAAIQVDLYQKLLKEAGPSALER